MIEVAVKLLEKPNQATKKSPVEVFQEFQQEVYLMSALDDPNIVPLLGICRPPRLAMIMEVVAGGDLYGQLNDPLGLRSSLSGFIDQLNAEFSAYNRSCSKILDFKNIFTNRHKLNKTNRFNFERHCVDALPKELWTSDVLLWIDQQICQDSRHPAIIALQNKPIEDYYGLTRDKLDGFLLPVMPELTTLGDGGLGKAQRAFVRWRDVLSRCKASEIPEVEAFESRFFGTVHALYDAYRHNLPFQRFKELKQGTDKMLEALETLSSSHVPFIAPISPMLRLKLALDVCRGMVHMHSLNPPIVHRDLKTPNVFLTRSLLELTCDDALWAHPLAKVGDFGLSLKSSFGGALRFESEKLNPTWAAPEILQGEKYTPAVDVYAMGLLMWELLMRQYPFSSIAGQTFKEFSQFVIADYVTKGGRPLIPDEVRKIRANCEFIELIESCWHQNPSERPSMNMIYGLLLQIARFHRFNPILNHAKSITTSSTSHLPSYHASSSSLSSLSSSLSPYHIIAIQSAPTVETYSVIPSLFSTPQAFPSQPFASKSFSVVRTKSCTGSGKSGRRSPTRRRSDLAQISPLDHCADELRIRALIAPFRHRELLWLGFTNGSVGVIDHSPDRQRQYNFDLVPLLCHPHEAHPQGVNTMVCFHGYGDSATIWSGSEDGTLSVWAGMPQSIEELYDVNWMQGSLKTKDGTVVWVECENGQLSWFPRRYDVAPIQSVQMDTEVRDVGYSTESNTLEIFLTPNQSVRFHPASDGSAVMHEWYRKLKNLVSATGSNIVRLASFQHSKAGIVALQSMDHVVWSADTQFVLNEWSLTSAADTGLHSSLKLTAIRQLKLDLAPLASRLSTISGFIRVGQSVLWVGVGDRWVIMYCDTLAWQWHEDASHKMGKLISVIPVQRGDQSEVWCLDDDARIFLWSYTVQSSVLPEFIAELSDPAWNADANGEIINMKQVHPDQLWVGTSSGYVFAWNIATRHLLPTQLQPIPAGHPASYKRGDRIRAVHCVVSIPDAPSPIMWSAGAGGEYQLRRFHF